MYEQSNSLFKEDVITHWAQVLLPLALPAVYTYAVPAALLPKTIVGCRVEVVFGKNKKYAGIIKSVGEQQPQYPTKPILNVLDDAPLLYPQQLQFWEWISEYYMCTEGEVMAAALPANFKLNSETILIYNDAIGEDFTNLNDEEFLVAEALLLKKQLQLTEVQHILD
jgi:primosomal protein N' (replication factor Y)